MAKANRAGALLLMMTMMALFGVSFGAVYNVGDSSGWSLGVNYGQWASTKNFQVGDTLVFNYNNQMHNLMHVSKEDYDSCNAKSPLATFSSGKDSITIRQPGHTYFLCGISGHCQAGLKVDISVGPSSQGSEVIPSPGVNPTPQNPLGNSPPASDLPSGQSIPCPPGRPFGPNEPGNQGQPFDPTQPGNQAQPFDPTQPGNQAQPYNPYKSAASSLSFQYSGALAVIVVLLANLAY